MTGTAVTVFGKRKCGIIFPSSGSNSVVECDLAKVEVAGSNPVSRSRFTCSEPALSRWIFSGCNANVMGAEYPRGKGELRKNPFDSIVLTALSSVVFP